MKKYIRIVVFLMIFCMLFLFVQRIFSAKWGPGTTGALETTNAIGFYEEPDNSLDVLLTGSSNIFYGSSPVKMFEKYGFASYVRGSANQPIMMMYYTILDSLRSQTPKVIVAEMGEMLSDFDPIGVEYSARRALDYMQFTNVKLNAINDLPIDGSDQTRISYVFPLLRYHSRWKELNKADLEYFIWEKHNYAKGQYIGRLRYDFVWPEGFMTPSDLVADVPAQNKEYLSRIVKLCEEKNIELILINTPVGTWDYAQHNAIQQVADEFGVPYIDYNLPEYIEATGITDTEDFHYNQWHLRVTGADKLSVHLGEYLTEKYELPNHWDEEAFAIWHEDVMRYNNEKEKAGLPK